MAKADVIQWEGDVTIPSDIEIFINATSIGLFPHVDVKQNVNYNSITPNMIVCDVIHIPSTPFLKPAM